MGCGSAQKTPLREELVPPSMGLAGDSLWAGLCTSGHGDESRGCPQWLWPEPPRLPVLAEPIPRAGPSLGPGFWWGPACTFSCIRVSTHAHACTPVSGPTAPLSVSPAGRLLLGLQACVLRFSQAVHGPYCVEQTWPVPAPHHAVPSLVSLTSNITRKFIQIRVLQSGKLVIVGLKSGTCQAGMTDVSRTLHGP